jgi:hypothetical protein
VAKTVAKYDLDDDTFRPTLNELLAALESSPKRFEKKAGKLRDCRAAEITFGNGTAWRAVFELNEAAREVRVLDLGPHDVAYVNAIRRRT